MRARRREPFPDRPVASPRAPLLFVHQDEQWEALASEPRQELMQFLGAIGPASIAELAHRMSAPADGLYHHVRVLLRAGLIRAIGERRAGNKREMVYDLSAQRLRFDLDIASGRNADRLRAIARARLSHAEKNLARALAMRELRLEEPLANAMIDGGSAWLEDEAFSRVVRHLQSAAQIMMSSTRAGRGRLYLLTMALAPLMRRRRADVRPTQRLARMRAAGP